jgi:protein arginine kinase activator
MPFPLAEILSSMAAASPSPSKAKPEEELVCPGCSMSFDEFTRQGRFGCGECYKAFRSRLEPIMRKIHGASLHRGRVPVPVSAESDDILPMPVKEEQRLEEELRKAINSEEFERAAEIRDKLKALKQSHAVKNEEETGAGK